MSNQEVRNVRVRVGRVGNDTAAVGAIIIVEEEEDVKAWMREETRRRSIPSGSGGSQTATAVAAERTEENGRNKSTENKPQTDLETINNRGGVPKAEGFKRRMG